MRLSRSIARMSGDVKSLVKERVSHATLGFIFSGATSSSAVLPEPVLPKTLVWQASIRHTKGERHLGPIVCRGEGDDRSCCSSQPSLHD